jgi:hypothetical protein
MARKIIYRENGLTGSNNTPGGYKYLGYDGLVLSEKTGATISAIGGGDYLPLSGGTMSGNIVFGSAETQISNAGGYLTLEGSAGGRGTIITLPNDSGIVMSDSAVRFTAGLAAANLQFNILTNTGGSANEKLKIEAKAATNFFGYLNFPEVTAERNWYLPNATGTIALTNQLPNISGTDKHFLQYNTSVLPTGLIDSPLSIEPGAGFPPDYHILSWKPGDGSIGEDAPIFKVENFAGTSRWLTIASSGQGSLEWNNASFYGGIYINSNITLTGNRIWDMPDASGTVALTQNQGYDNFIEVSISSAEILSLSTTPKDVLPVLTGSDYYDYKVIFEYTYGTTPYNNGGGSFLIVDNLGRGLTTMENLNAVTYSFASNYTYGSRVRPATGLSCSIVSPTTLGDGTVNLKVYYTTHTL